MRARRWLLAIVPGVAVIIVGAAVLTRHPHQEAPKAAAPDKIGLRVAREANGVRLEWNRSAPSVRRATHALLYIQDGNHKSRLDLTDQQLAGSDVRYWPEKDAVRFRLELYGGPAILSDEVTLASEPGSP